MVVLPEEAMNVVARAMGIESKVTAVLLEKEENATDQRVFEIFNEKPEVLIDALRSIPDEFDSPSHLTHY